MPLDLVIGKPRRGTRFTTNINVVRDHNVDDRDVDELGEDYRGDIARRARTSVSAAVPILVGGERGVSYTWRANIPGRAPQRARQVTVLHSGAATVITLTATPARFDGANRDFLSILRSWRWK